MEQNIWQQMKDEGIPNAHASGFELCVFSYQ